MRGFVQEVLRRSRTSGSVLQTALCYLEAVRAKVPELIRHGKNSPETAKEAGSSERPTCIEDGPTSTDDIVFDGRSSFDDFGWTYGREVDSLCADLQLGSDDVLHNSRANTTSLPPLPPLPSPLLCPRRTFLASLILASKFTQDKCYSNRAWAKLSGLSPREIGRCERALGEALEWRLWVGKLPAVQSSFGRSLTKSKSEKRYHQLRHATYPSFESHGEILPSRLAPQTTASMVVPQTTWTPSSLCATSPSTPGLSFSPTPTESSAGDRTVQVSSFMDVLTPPPGQFAAFTGAQNSKASLVSNDPCIYSISQDAPLPPHPFEGLHLPNSGFPLQLPPRRAMYPQEYA
ncbi:hypothetical protein F5141DRAFT_1090521 [Pisolithus sp. B1]|nr:hypothetical protein F5141DRAFT_1090521 [Pisolithus sp. B1]